MRRQNFLVLSLVTVLLLSLWNTQPLWTGIAERWNTFTRPSWIVLPGQTVTESGADPDTILIHEGLLKAPHFSDTLRWWTGTWAGQVKFYRPLPSLLFWAEWKLYGDWENRYALFPLLFYFLALYQFLRLMADFLIFIRCPLPAVALLLGGLIFTNGWGMFPLRSMTNGTIMGYWKNQPDTLCALFFFLSLRAYLRLLPQSTPQKANDAKEKNRTEANDLSSTSLSFLNHRYLWAALALYLAACASKESGVVLPLLLIGLEWSQLRSEPRLRQEAIRRLTPFFVALPLFLLFRTWCLGTSLGFRDGSNGSWLFRTVSSALGPISAAAVLQQWSNLVLGVLFAFFLWKGRVLWVIKKRRANAFGVADSCLFGRCHRGVDCAQLISDRSRRTCSGANSNGTDDLF